MPTGLGGEQLWISATNDNTGTSTAFDDQSGQGNDGTAVGGTTVVADTENGGSYAFDFNGSGKYIDCGNILSAPSEWSISLWVDKNGTVASNAGLAGTWHSSKGYSLVAGTSTQYPQLLQNTGPYPVGTSALADAWTHVVGLYDSTDQKVKLYENGILIDEETQPSGPIASLSNFLIGAYGNGLSANLNGRMDDIRAYTRVLSQTEITHLASSRGVLGVPSEPTTGFYNPFINKIFNNDYTRRIR